MADFWGLLANDRILIADGATGTRMQRMDLPPGMAPELWNADRPDTVRELYRAYVQAGSNVILTNTFGGTRVRLDMEGAGDRVYELNKRAAQLSRDVSGDDVIVLGSMGPTGQLLGPMGPLSYEDCKANFVEQAGALAAGGVDALLVETMSDLNEARAAVEGAKAVTNLPILVTMSFDTHGRTMMGVTPELAARELWSMGLAAIGANCGRTLSETLTAIRAMRQAVPEATLMAKPNAGMPHLENMQAVYDVTPGIMSDYALQFAQAGVKIFGGCCGSTADHIKAVADALAGVTVVKPQPPSGQMLVSKDGTAAESEALHANRPRRRRDRRARRDQTGSKI
jgi:5-methyltetrahydrofolate--homocysteine methyltransferase